MAVIRGSLIPSVDSGDGKCCLLYSESQNLGMKEGRKVTCSITNVISIHVFQNMIQLHVSKVVNVKHLDSSVQNC